MDFNAIVQWSCVAVILLAAIAAAIRGVVRLVKQTRDKNANPGCSCGCSGCALSSECSKPAKRESKGDGATS